MEELKTNFQVRDEIKKKFDEWIPRIGLEAEVVNLYIEADLGRSWGMAGREEEDPGEWTVQISMMMMVRQPEEIEETVVHELAHVVVFTSKRRCEPHGREWQAVMREHGFTPSVTKRRDEEAVAVWARR